MHLPWVRRALARLQKPRWSVALPGKTLENCQWIYITDTSRAFRKFVTSYVAYAHVENVL